MPTSTPNRRSVPSAAHNKKNRVKTIRCIVACTNSNGSPDLFFLKITAPEDKIDDGRHYDKAKKIAANEGYAGPYVVFDETDSAGKAMLKLFVWKSASEHILL